MESHKVHVPKHQPNVLRSDRARDFFVQFSMNQQPLWGGWGSHPLTNSLGQHSTGDGIKKKILVDPPRGSVRENKDHLQEILVRQVGR